MSTVLLGRDNERESLDLLLRGVRAGRSGLWTHADELNRELVAFIGELSPVGTGV
jgi:hypothetical protein